MKRALITGIAGQDGSYLAEHLLAQGYEVFGIVRRNPESCENIRHLLDKVTLFYGDVTDRLSINAAIVRSSPNEIYNLAAQVFVPVSWYHADETFNANVGGLARILEAVERIKPEVRVYQASTSEMFGNVHGVLNEDAMMCPASPYGAAKLAAHKLVAVYRQKGYYVVGGILFNHESERRGPEMVTRKITKAVARFANGDTTPLQLGDITAERDWGFAGDYVKAMHAMLQCDSPEDFVIGTGCSYSVKTFLEMSLAEIGLTLPEAVAKALVQANVPEFNRACDIKHLLADSSKAHTLLNWFPETSFPDLVKRMVDADIKRLRNEPSSECAAVR